MRSTILALAFVAAAGSALAVAQEGGKVYRFGTDAKHTNITFVSEAEIENIYGVTHKASGQTWLDFGAGTGKCSIRVPVDSLDTGIALRNEHLRSDQWMDAAKYPEITLASDGFDLVVRNADKGIYEAKFKGKLTIHGVTRDLATTAKVVKIGAEQAKKMGGGEWVRITAGFEVTLKDFGITIPEGPVVAKVSPTWTVKFDCYATTLEPQRK